MRIAGDSGESAHFGDESARRGDREMRMHRLDALPLLDEDEAVGVLDIDMAVMRQTPRLAPRPRAVTPDLIRGRRRA